ncbi:hypothetical protein Tco_1274184 [Tanacetum coccineum]
MTSNSKVDLGYEIQSNNEVLSYEEEINRTVFKCTEGDFLNKPLYSRFIKTDSFKGVPHPLTGDYTPKPQEEIDDSFEGSFGNPSEHSSESESESISVPNEMSTSKSVTANEKVVSELKEVEPSLQLNAGRPNINSVRPNINTSRTNINSVRPNVNTGRVNVYFVRPNVNTGRVNVNSVKSNVNTRQPVPIKTSNNFSPKRP